MNRQLFLSKLTTALCTIPFLSRFARAETTDFAGLEEAFCKAANALTDYRHANGLEPGVRVRAQYLDEPPKFGVIAPYGEIWGSVDHECVPVMLDKGSCQPWRMSELEVMGTHP